MIDYILFEKKSENDRPVWNDDLVKSFCEEQKFDYQDIREETLFYVVRIAPETEDPDQHYRLLEITPTISFILKDDPSLNEFMELDAPTRIETPNMTALSIEDNKKDLKE
jgi:hypothetical protein